MARTAVRLGPPAAAGGAQPGADPPRGVLGLTRPLVVAGLLCALVALFLLTIAAGSVTIPLDDVVRIVVGGEPARPAWTTIVTDIRLPRAITATLAGAGLGVGGLLMQTLFRNPLADPFILGISAGASLGVALVVLVAGSAGTTLVGGLAVAGNVGVAGAAAAGAAVVTVAVLAVSRRMTSPATVLIIGLMFGYAATAVVSVLVYSGFGRFERIRAFIAWGFGSFGGTTWTQLRVLVPCVLVGLVVAALLTKQLNALLLGDRYAASMGLHVARARTVIVLAASLLAGVVTAFCGPIAFIGVAVPHMARGLLRTSDHRLLVPAVVVVGGIVALTAGLVAQLPGQDATLPLNAVTSLVGAPVVVVILMRLRHASQAVVT
ncbi:MAG TPA: iron ABC transporter permease [Egibacteraceae bacterium]|nr:iron ABC transporter permease [Egibacteraceae bacterium]